MTFAVHHARVTASTNLDARAGRPGDVFTADEQTAGRGRLDHVWLSPPGSNLLLSAVFDVADLAPAAVATFPLVAGLAVADALRKMLSASAHAVAIKWPNDVWVDGRKICGILCERCDDRLVAGLGVNVNQTAFAPELEARATSLARCGVQTTPSAVRDAVLAELGACYETWRHHGFAALRPRYAALDALAGRVVSVRQTDDDAAPVTGLCGGVAEDGTLLVGDVRVSAGEAHVLLKSNFSLAG